MPFDIRNFYNRTQAAFYARTETTANVLRRRRALSAITKQKRFYLRSCFQNEVQTKISIFKKKNSENESRFALTRSLAAHLAKVT